MVKKIGYVMLILLVLQYIFSCGGGGGGSGSGGSGDSTPDAGSVDNGYTDEVMYDSDMIAESAIADLGGDTEAGAAILMALAQGMTLREIVESIEAGTLSDTGTIETAAIARFLFPAVAYADTSQGLEDICGSPGDSSLCREEIREKIDFYLTKGFREEYLTAIILLAANRGYSAAQITNALTDVFISKENNYFGIDRTGKIFLVNHDDDGTSVTLIEPDNQPPDVFSDQDPNDSEDEVDNDGDLYTENGGDCDDTDLSIYPGAEEICGDGVDQDCDGYDLSCDDVGETDPYPWEFRGAFTTDCTMVSGDASASMENSGYYELTLNADGTVEGTVTLLPGTNIYPACGPEIKTIPSDESEAPVVGTHGNGEISIGAKNYEPSTFGVYDGQQITFLDHETETSGPAPTNCLEENPGFPYTRTCFVQYEPLLRTNPQE